MNGKLVHNRSSFLVIWPIVGAMFLCCVLGFIFKAYFLSLIMLVFSLIMTAARVWSAQAVKELGFSVYIPRTGVFPGESFEFRIDIKNNKFLPLVCSEVYFPLSKDLCLVPDEARQVEEYEKAYLSEYNASLEKVGEQSLPTLLWYESQTIRSNWTAKRRGIYSTVGWKLRTGDGFGLSQMELPLEKKDIRQIAVFPQIVPVITRSFFRMAWSADTGARGVMEDNTVIRSTRDYQMGDSIKHINWRLTARGLPLNVNTYEEILPQSVYFIFDGESFSGAQKHLNEMEDAMSIVSSVILALDGKVRSGISFSLDAENKFANVPSGAQVEDLLWAFSAYRPQEDLRNEENKIVDRPPLFDIEAIEKERQNVGRYYYIVYDADALKKSPVLEALGSDKVTVFSCKDAKPYGDHETVCLMHLKREGETGRGQRISQTAAPEEPEGNHGA